MARLGDIGLAGWHIFTHTGGHRRTALRQVLAQIAPTVQGRLAAISDDGAGNVVVTCYADPHGCDPRSTQLVATFAEARWSGMRGCGSGATTWLRRPSLIRVSLSSGAASERDTRI